MAQNVLPEGLVIEQPSLRTANFLSFQIKREGWEIYKIEDSTLIKARIIIASVLMEGKLEDAIAKAQNGQQPILKLSIAPRIEFAVEPSQELRGDPDKRTYTPEQLKSSVIHEDMDFEIIRSTWNLYELENGIVLKVRYLPMNIDKTSKFDNGGMPVYLVNGNADIKIEFPEHLRKLLEKRQTTPNG